MVDKLTKVKARAGETLCEIAIRRGGFINCDRLRDHPDNAKLLVATLKKGALVTVPPHGKKVEGGKATKKKHPFKKPMAPPPALRFVHGSKASSYRLDATLGHLNVSNYPSDKGGRYPTATAGPVSYATMPTLPSGFGYDDDGHLDEDTFKIEVVDPKATGNTIKVKLTALKPVYLAGKVDGYATFAAGDPDSAARSVEVECERVKAGLKVFRSRYMRLVTNINDFNAINAHKQALLVGPVADGTGGANDEVEVLDQRVRAEYQLSFCKASKGPKCKIVRELPVGRSSRRRRVKTAVHILRNGRGGAGVATIQQVRQSLLNFVREIYAQADLSLKLVNPQIQLIQPPTNMITISDRLGRRAQGGKTISVRVRVDAALDKTVSITTVANHTPTQTATRLAKKIRSECKEKAVVTRNPPIIGRAIGSADILVGDPATQNVRLNVVTSADTQAATIGRIVGTTITEFGADDLHVGTMDERVLVKNNDSGSKRIDTFVVGTLSAGSFGEAFIPTRNKTKNRRPRPFLVNSVIIKAQTLNSTTHVHRTIPHEWGHLLTDIGGHIVNPASELLGTQFPTGTTDQPVNAPRRIGDPPNNKSFSVTWQGNIKSNPVRRLRTKNRSLLTRW